MAAVSSGNRFEILSEEIPAAAAATVNPAEKPKTEAPAAKASQRGRSGPASKSGRYYPRGGGVQSTPRESAEGEDVPPREGKRFGEERGRGRGRGGRGRGERGERGRGGHGRVFDRHSATGKTDSEKKISQGWGADEGDKELKAEEEGLKDATAEAPVDDWGVGPDAAAATDAAVDTWGISAAEGSGDVAKEDAPAETRYRREEEEDNTLTYDQYMAQLKEKATVPKVEEVRKPNDGADDLFKGAVQLVKDTEEDVYYAAKTKAARQRAKAAEKKQVETIYFDGPFADRQTRGGRGGRGGDRGARGGGGRGRGGRGRGRGEGAFNQPVNVDDQNAFPALS